MGVYAMQIVHSKFSVISIHLTFHLLYSGEQIRKDNLSSKNQPFSTRLLGNL